MKDFRPYFIKKAFLKFQRFYTNHFIRPKLRCLGNGFNFMRPWDIELFGTPIRIGAFATIIAASDRKIRLVVWPQEKKLGHINIGDFCIICPGVRISSACAVDISDNCMIASNVYISDCDWHGVYNRTLLGEMAPVRLDKNVWIGDSAIICKGVNIGSNSVVGAGAVVVDSVPSNVVVAGNPAKIVKVLDSTKKFVARDSFFSNPIRLAKNFREWEFFMLRNNTFIGWIKHLLFPSNDN